MTLSPARPDEGRDPCLDEGKVRGRIITRSGLDPGLRRDERVVGIERARFARGASLLLLAAAVWMAIDLPAFPIALWDESRLAVNALEMRQTGLSLVTTYGFRPDLWNTKPPLLIWLMTLCTWVFGPSEGALRIPSALATLGSAAVVMGFTWRMTRTAFAPLAAGFLLLTTRGFVGRHSGQTADYEALLCFFVTAYSCLFALVLHRRRPKAGWVLLAGLLVAGAVLTKGVAGLAPGVGVALYMLVQRRVWRPLQSWSYVAAALLACGFAAAFYLGREHVAPGYLHAVAMNELGRYGAIVEGHHNPPWYYPLLVFGAFGFSLGLLSLPLLAEVRRLEGRRRAGMVFALAMTVGILGVFSLGATKIRWYADPVYPFLAIGCGIGLESFRDRWRARRGVGAGAPRPAYEAAVLWGGAVVLTGVIFIVRDAWPTFEDPRTSGRYGAVFNELHRRGVDRVEVRDGGVRNMQGDIGYAPQLQAYAVIWRERGLRVVRRAVDAPRPTGVTASCDAAEIKVLGRWGSDISRTPGCFAVEPDVPIAPNFIPDNRRPRT